MSRTTSRLYLTLAAAALSLGTLTAAPSFAQSLRLVASGEATTPEQQAAVEAAARLMAGPDAGNGETVAHGSQRGSGNRIGIRQSSGNVATVRQNGCNREATINQSNRGNAALVVQAGCDGPAVNMNQTGDQAGYHIELQRRR